MAPELRVADQRASLEASAESWANDNWLGVKPPLGASQPVLGTSVLWAVRVLAWIAFGLTSYLALKSIGHGVSSSCITGSADCEAVQSSSWSVWLGVPVAVLGLGCYSSLAGLSVAAGAINPRAGRWISTGLVMLSLLAALSGLWFTGLQFFALGKICVECMAVHVCGISIAALVVWSTLKMAPAPTWSRGNAASLLALRAAIPGAPVAAATRSTAGGPMPAAALSAGDWSRSQSRPRYSLAVGGALALVSLLAGGQVLFPASGSTSERVALANPIQMDATGETSFHSPGGDSTGKQVHVANKISTEAETSGEALPNGPPVDVVKDEKAESGESAAKAAEASPPKSRIVKFLDDSLSIDVYRHPVLGSRESPHFVIEFVSYDCPHCHETHRIMRQALERYGDQVAVIVLVMPMEMECNTNVTSAANSIVGACLTARMALGVSTLDSGKFEHFHDWLMAPPKTPPSPAAAMQKAYNTVGRERILSFSKQDFQEQIDQNIELYNSIEKSRRVDAKKGGLPLIVVGNLVQSGTPANAEKFIQSWEAELGVKPSATDGSLGL